MKSLSTLCLATLTVFAGASLLYSQATSTQGGYSIPQGSISNSPSGFSNSPSGFSNPNMAAYPNNPGYQPDMNAASQNMRGNQMPNMQNSDQWTTDQNKMNNNPNQPYTQPSNLANPSRVYGNNGLRGNDFLTWKDDDIAQKIRWAIRDDKSLSPLAKSAEVSVKNYNVTLTGTVSSEDEKSKVASIARQVDGVKSISNNLQISNK